MYRPDIITANSDNSCNVQKNKHNLWEMSASPDAFVDNKQTFSYLVKQHLSMYRDEYNGMCFIDRYIT